MGRAEDFRGNQLIFRRTKGEISRNRHEGGGGGSRESSKVIRRDHFNEVTFKGGLG